MLDDQLMLPDRADQSFLAIQFGSEACYGWLDEPAIRSFAFHGPQGTLIARREHRYTTGYWYAYRSQEGHLFNICSKLNVRGCTQAIAKVRTLGKDMR